jgi:hypothetical protein
VLVNCLTANGTTGAAHSQNSRSQFWLQDLCGKDYYVFEEFKVDVFNADYFKCLLEGSLNVLVEQKNLKAQHLVRRPVLTTGNEYPWQLVSSVQQAYRERAIIILTHSPIPVFIYDNPNIRKDLLLKCRELIYNVINEC